MVTEALRQIGVWTIPAIQQTLSAYCRELLVAVEPLGFTAVPADRRAGHFLGLRRAQGMSADLASRLAAAGVYASVRGNSLRVTPHLYNNRPDLDRFVAALTAATAPG